MSATRIIIVGSGFGGVYTARELARLSRKGEFLVTLVNRTNYFLFTLLLHEVATGGLSPRSVAEPLREVFRGTCVEFVQDSVHSINLEAQTVSISARELPYDYLVIATGATTNFYGIPGAAEFGLTLKNLEEAGMIRDRIIDTFERAASEIHAEARSKLLSFIIVGGGATGVELAGELADFAFRTMPRYYGRIPDLAKDISVTLISSGGELLELFHPLMRRVAKETLEKKGVRVLLGTKVMRVLPEGVEIQGGGFIPGSMVLWLAGVAPALPNISGPIPLHESGRIRVDEYLRSSGSDRVFALGDAAAVTRLTRDGRPLPMFAQIAVREAVTVAKNIIRSAQKRPLRAFEYRSQGDLISLGQWFALGDVYGFRIKGRFTWWLWRTVYLFKFISWKKRIKIAVEWTINLFYPRDITKTR